MAVCLDLDTFSSLTRLDDSAARSTENKQKQIRRQSSVRENGAQGFLSVKSNSKPEDVSRAIVFGAGLS